MEEFVAKQPKEIGKRKEIKRSVPVLGKKILKLSKLKYQEKVVQEKVIQEQVVEEKCQEE
jgi:hypothetical protein